MESRQVVVLFQALALSTACYFVYFSNKNPTYGDSCMVETLTPRVRSLLVAIEKEQNMDMRAWYNHTLYERPTVVLDGQRATKCVTLRWPSGKVDVWQSADALESGDMRWSWITPNSTSDKLPKSMGEEVKARLRLRGSPTAYLYVIGRWRENYQHFPTQAANSVRLALHEAFHIFSQGSQHWPDAFRIIPDNQYRHYCYGSTAAARELHHKEMYALIDSYLQPDDRNAKRLAKEYLNLKRQRQNLVGDLQYRDMRNLAFQTSCAQAEASLEYKEGVAQFVGNQFILNLGLATPQEIATEVRWSTDCCVREKWQPVFQNYYHAGALQLHLIRRFYQGNFLQLTEKITRNDSKLTLSELLESVTN